MCIGVLYRGIQCVLGCYTEGSNAYWAVIQRNPMRTGLLYRKNMYSSIIGRNAM